MDDALLVDRARGGDLDAFGQLYDRYFNRIYDFAWRVLRDADEAADVTQDAFMKAMQNLHSLSKAASFKSWLFTIAHNAAVTRAERAGRTVPLPQPVHEEAFGSFDVADPSRLNDPELVAGDAELASLVWEAAGALNPRDYALLDLHVRQGLESSDIAGVMGVSKGNAYTMVSRMKTAAADVIGSYVVARRSSHDCDGLRAALQRFEFPPYTEEVRKAVELHMRDCETCQGSRRRLTAPLEIFGGFAMLPAPLALKGDIWGNVSSAWYVTGPGAIGEAGEVAGADGLPPSPYAAAGAGGGAGGVAAVTSDPGEGGWDRNRLMWFIGGVAGLLIFAFAGGAIIAGAFDGGDSEGAGAEGTTTVTSTPAVTVTVGVVVNTPTPAPPTATPPPAPTETVTPTAAPATPTAAVDVTATSISATQTAAAIPPPSTPTSALPVRTPTPRVPFAPTPTPCLSTVVCPPTPQQ